MRLTRARAFRHERSSNRAPMTFRVIVPHAWHRSTAKGAVMLFLYRGRYAPAVRAATGGQGPNGAGKTTTLEILEGFIAPTGGTIRVLGTDPRHGGRAWRARVGLVLQSTALDAEL